MMKLSFQGTPNKTRPPMHHAPLPCTAQLACQPKPKSDPTTPFEQHDTAAILQNHFVGQESYRYKIVFIKAHAFWLFSELDKLDLHNCKTRPQIH